VNNHDGHRPASPDPAATVAELLAGSLAADQHLSAADRDEASALTQAMARLLLGAPLRSDGKLTVKTLAEEAGLKRNKLTHKHTGLKDLFYALVNTRHAEPAMTADLRAETTNSARPWPNCARPAMTGPRPSNGSPASCTSWKSRTSGCATKPPQPSRPPDTATRASTHCARRTATVPGRTHPMPTGPTHRSTWRRTTR
jgi:hypothetical protein